MLKLRKIFIPVALTTMLFVMTACNSGLNLFLDAKEGDSYTYNAKTKMDTKLTLNGNEMSVKQNQEMDYSLSVDKVDADKNITVGYKYEAYKMDMESAGITMSYDSKKPDKESPLSSIFGNLIGKGFSAKMTSKGDVLEVSGLSEMMSSMTDSIEEPTLKEKMRTDLEKQFGDEATKSMIAQSMKAIPKDVVNVGDSWEASYNIQSIMPIEIKVKYTLEKVENGIATIAVVSEFKTDPEKEIDFITGKVKTNLKGNITGKMNINKNNAFLMDGEMTQKISGEVIMSAKKEMKLPLEITSVTTYTTSKN